MAKDYKEEIERLGFLAFVPDGTSMWPILKPKKQTVILKNKTDRLKKFDVGFYIDGKGRYIFHRVNEVLPDGYIFMGDGQTVKETVKEDAVFAVMTGFYKGKKFIKVSDEKYIKRVFRWYKDEKKRVKKIERLRSREMNIAKIKRLFIRKEK